jgi:excisionase family DNA binding protein
VLLLRVKVPDLSLHKTVTNAKIVQRVQTGNQDAATGEFHGTQSGHESEHSRQCDRDGCKQNGEQQRQNVADSQCIQFIKLGTRHLFDPDNRRVVEEVETRLKFTVGSNLEPMPVRVIKLSQVPVKRAQQYLSLVKAKPVQARLPNHSGLFTVGQAAEKIGITVTKLRRMCREKKIKHVRVDYRNYLFSQADLDSFLKAKTFTRIGAFRD